MKAEIQLFYIGTSKVKEIRAGGNVTFDWGAYGEWTKFENPVADSKKNIKYKKTAKNKPGVTRKTPLLGGGTVLGTAIPATAQRFINGVERTCDVRYWQRGHTIYTRTAKLKKSGKMLRTKYTPNKPYMYRLQYKDKPVVEKVYSTYENGTEYVFFGDHYFSDDGNEISTTGHLPHPVECSLSYSDVRRNFESNANNSDGRDNTGVYVLSNVRVGVVTLTFTWKGLTSEEGAELLDTLNPDKDPKTGDLPYVIVQYLDHATGKARNGTFFADSRTANKYPNGRFKEITVTLTEV